MSIRSLLTVAALGCTVGTASTLSAQTTDSSAAPTPASQKKWEFLMTSGAVVPTGAERSAIKRGNLSAAQLTYVARPALALTATVGWARTRDIASAGDPKLDVFTYDVGAEVRSNRWNADQAVTVRPFAGIGAGARSYNYRSLDINATHNAAAYASMGGEAGYRRVRVRIEARDYVTGYKPLVGSGTSDTRNDVVVMAGFRLATR
ncbi:MAG: hypothetical protein ABI625_06815 [bacterium]